MAMSQVVNTYPLSNYSFGTKEPKLEKDTSVADRLARMKINYMKEGMRTSVDAILLVQEHNHPHILLLQIGNTFCKLPGGRLKPGENEVEGLKRKLTSKLGGNSAALVPDWKVGECVATWWRPNFETMMYPYCPPHITKPKECKRLYIVHLSEKEYFAVPKNLKLLAVPLFELYDNVQRYGPVISTIPQQLSRFHFNMIKEEEHHEKGAAKVLKKAKEKAKKIKNALTKHGHGHEQELHGGAPARGRGHHVSDPVEEEFFPDPMKEEMVPPGKKFFPVVSSSHSTKPSGRVKGAEASISRDGYGNKVISMVTPVYEKVKGTGAIVMKKLPFSSGGTHTERENKQGQDKGISAKEYLTKKLRPGEGDKALSEVVTEKLHLGGDKSGSVPVQNRFQ
uniref:Pre-mRNA cleavage factor Im 25 kDa subunit n=1 Tax=Brassica campestris TaxID=3711 RepID=M4D1V7_BRACM